MQDTSIAHTFQLGSSWTIDLSGISDPPDFYFLRHVKYWKERKYSWRSKHMTGYRQCINRFSQEISDEIDRQVLADLRVLFEQDPNYGTEKESAEGDNSKG